MDDISLEVFHEPIVQDPYRISGRGGGLAIYINKTFRESDDITPLFDKDAEILNKEPEANPPGEFLFVKLAYKTQHANNM